MQSIRKGKETNGARKNEIKIPYCSMQQNSRICTQTASRANPHLPESLFRKSGILNIFIYMLPMQTFQVPPAFSNGLSRFCKWYKRKAYCFFPVNPWIIPKVMVIPVWRNSCSAPCWGKGSLCYSTYLPLLDRKLTERMET